MTDDLTYKLEIQAELNAGNTVAQLQALQDRTDQVRQSNQISIETWDEVVGALEAAERRLRDYSTVVPTLVADQKLITEWSKNHTAALKEEAAEQGKVEAAQKSAAAAGKIAANEQKAAAAEQEAALNKVKAAQEKLSEAATRADTLTSRTGFNAINAGAATASAAANRLPNTIRTTAPENYEKAVAYNQQIRALQGQITAAQEKYNAAVKQGTAAYKEQLAQIVLEKGEISGADLAAAQERLRQSTVGATNMLKEQTAAIVQQGKELETVGKKSAALNSMGTTSRGGGGASFAALYLQQQTYQKTGEALMGLGVQAVKTSADYEAAFANVARTTEDTGKSTAGNIEYIRQHLMAMDEQVPLSFEALSKIAAAGNEAGVSAAGILAFTKTVAEYSTVTGTSVDATTAAFGSLNQIMHLNNAEYTNLGASISYVGRMSAASEPQIVAMLDQMASAAEQAGLTKQQIVGLAGAFASVKIAPEGARSAIQAYTKTLNDALAGGTKHGGIAEWGKVLGMKPEDASHLAQTNASAFMQKFLQTLNNSSSVGKTKIFEDLGLNNTRTINAFTRLSGSIPMLKKLLDDANTSWAKGTDLQNQYGKATNTLAAHFGELQNATANLMTKIGSSGLTKEAGMAVDALLKIVKALSGFAGSNPGVVRTVTTLALLAGAALTVKAAMLGVMVAAKAFSFFGTSAVEVTGFRSALVLLGSEMGFIKLKSVQAAAAEIEVGVAAGIAEGDVIGASTTMSGAFGTLAGAAKGAGAAGATAGAEIAGGAAVAGEGVATGAKVAGAGIAVGGTLATAGLWAVLAAVGALISWLLTDLPGAAKFGAGALGWIADAADAVHVPLVMLGQTFLGLASIVAAAGTAIINTLAAITSGFGLFGNGLSDALGSLGGQLSDATGGMMTLANDTGQMNSNFKDSTDSARAAARGLADWADKQNKASGAAKASKPDMSAINKAMKDAADAGKSLGAGGNDAANGLGNAGDAAKNAAPKIRTLTDYASDLTGVLSRAFDIQFGPTQGRDAIISTFDQMKQNALQAAQAVTSTKNEIAKLQAEMNAAKADNVKENYFLGIANQFGDSLRASQIQSTIQTNDTTIQTDQSGVNDNKAKLADEEDKATKSLTGNTSGAAANREALIGLAQKYQDYIGKLASSGATQKQLTTATAAAKKEFEKQATQLGFNKTAVGKVADSFDYMKTVIGKVPRNLTMNVNANPALEALKEFAAKAAQTAKDVNKSMNGIGKGGAIGMPHITNNNNDAAIRRGLLEAELATYTKMFANSARNGVMSNAAINAMNSAEHIRRQLASGSYADGGYTGPGGKYEPAGVVHRGEYVVPQQYVNQSTGLPFADALGRLAAGTQVQQSSYAQGGYVNPGMQVVELGPRSMAAVRDVARQEAVAVISAGGLAGAVNSVNRNTRRRGGG